MGRTLTLLKIMSLRLFSQPFSAYNTKDKIEGTRIIEEHNSFLDNHNSRTNL